MAKKTGDTIRIRMYHVGFGDCFLVRFPGRAGGFFHVLVDCGVHPQGNIGAMDRVVENIAAETGEKLAVVVATHAHQDHISGFGRYAGEFRKFTIGEVWMPWTEDKDNPTAVELRQKQKAAIARLQMAFAGMPAAGRATNAAAQALANLTGNDAALDRLHAGFGAGAKVRYFEAGDTAGTMEGTPGLEARFLGPPTDPNFLARMDPPASQHYLAAGAGKAVEIPAPFGPKWVASEAELPVKLTGEEEEAINAYASEPPGGMAFALDQAINNTSLVILFTFGGRHLLFPGDAQYGNWQYWLQKPDSGDVLAEVDFLKVAHHGSMNATPKQAIDHMGHGTMAAMVSTQNRPWPSIPREPLMKAIQGRTRNRLMRSDAPAGPVPTGFVRGEDWFDYEVKV